MATLVERLPDLATEKVDEGRIFMIFVLLQKYAAAFYEQRVVHRTERIGILAR
jgi:hypothetical protein